MHGESGQRVWHIAHHTGPGHYRVDNNNTAEDLNYHHHYNNINNHNHHPDHDANNHANNHTNNYTHHHANNHSHNHSHNDHDHNHLWRLAKLHFCDPPFSHSFCPFMPSFFSAILVITDCSETCAKGKFASGCDAQNHTICSPCSSCVPGETYMAFACAAKRDTVCVNCTTCGLYQEETAPCVGSQNRVCSDIVCGSCPKGSYKLGCNNTATPHCVPCTECELGVSYMVQECSDAADRQCRACNNCSTPGQRIKTQCTLNEDAVCEEQITATGSSQFGYTLYFRGATADNQGDPLVFTTYGNLPSVINVSYGLTQSTCTIFCTHVSGCVGVVMEYYSNKNASCVLLRDLGFAWGAPTIRYTFSFARDSVG